MRVKDIMTSPVLTIPSTMPVLEAAKIMKDRKIERLPVVNGGKLLGIVTKDRVLRSSPSMATSLSLHEMHYLFAKLTVAEIMNKAVTVVSPEMTIENAVRLAQEKQVGCLPVVENGHVVGILTTNDFFLLLLNPLLGIGEKGSRLIVRQCADLSQVTQALQCAMDLELEVLNAAYLSSRRGGQHEFILHVNTENATTLLERMRSRGLEVEVRER
jgi:acetoin utilization protein AcuB